jgi:hypothetical protein
MSSRKKAPTLTQVYSAIAASLVEFGYPDATAEMVRATHEAMKRGDSEMPHGIVGMFAQSQLDEIADALTRLKP